MADPTARTAPATGPATGPRSGSAAASAAARGVSADVPCPNCGERVRPGLVRCWSCGGFMREDVADRYAQLHRDRAEVEYRPLPELKNDGGLTGEIPKPGAAAPGRGPDDDHDDDFELSGEFSVGGRPPAPAAAPPPAAPPAPGPAALAAERGGADAGGGQSDVPHSEATGGDVLLEIAMQEEGRSRPGRRRGLRVQGDKILLHCPAGHPVKVARKHAGKVGRCPHPGCGLRYLVPDLPPADDAPAEDASAGESGEHAPGAASAPAAAGPPDELAAGAFTRYVDGVRLHTVVPGKVKAKADSQAKAFQPADVAFSPEALLVVTVEGKKGVFGVGAEKPEQVRQRVREHLGGETPEISALPVPHVLLAGANAGEVAVEYPSDLPHESKFGGEPVFGTGRIALRLPRTGGEPDADQPPEKQETRFLSMTLSQFRRFAAAMEEFGFAGGPGGRYAADTPIPRTDDAPVHTGHYTDAPVPELPRPDLYLADPRLNAVVAGYRCQHCGLIVSEDGRKKEKLGGANGKGLAKAKCPKCGEPFGDRPLYKLVDKPG